MIPEMVTLALHQNQLSLSLKISKIGQLLLINNPLLPLKINMNLNHFIDEIH